jgi:hypothetical protein
MSNSGEIITGTKAKIYSRLQINEVQDLNSKPDSKPVLLLTPDSVNSAVRV